MMKSNNKKTKHKWRPRILRGLVYLSLVGIVCIAGLYGYAAYKLGPLKLTKSNNLSIVVLDRRQKLLRPYTTKEGIWRLPVKLENIDPKLIKVLLAYEDRRFYHHFGVDPFALIRAGWLWAKHGRIISGGSTITMQVARLLEGQKGRALSTKLLQIVRAIQLEQHFTKQEILRLYFTLAPYGGNIEGVRAASLAYFSKEPKRLSPHEIALLVALPQAPRTRRIDRHPKNAKIGRDRILRRMLKYSVLPKSDVERAISRPIPSKRFAFPILAAHLADSEIKKAPEKKEHILTIDKNLQNSLEKLTSEHVSKLGPKLSAAVLVADHKTGETLAYVGSPGYLDQKRFGSIDMIQAVRSPGSALKPFVYGLAFEAGIAHPETMIEDSPIKIGSYAPENFDKLFRGTLSVRQALQVSLNVPVIKLLAKIGPARLVSKFKVAGITTKIPRNLSIALGGVGIRLKELAQLYSAFPRGGVPISLRHKLLNKDEKIIESQNKQILSETASWYITDILRGTKPPLNSIGGRIAFKTGTSYGNRDAWSVGYDGRHVIATWIGRPDNTATPGLVGIKAAAPLLFQAFQRVSPSRTPLKQPPEAALVTQLSSELPPPLQHFDKRFKIQNAQSDNKNAIQITFPDNKSQVEILKDEEGNKLPLLLKARGGKLPLTWLINDAPINSKPYKHETFWTPDTTGFIKLTVIDAEGSINRIRFKLQKPEF